MYDCLLDLQDKKQVKRVNSDQQVFFTTTVQNDFPLFLRMLIFVFFASRKGGGVVHLCI